MKFFHLLGFILLITTGQLSFAQTQPFYSDIQHFKKEDSLQLPPKNAILFLGSSSFTKWTDVQSYFPSYPILNRGFGGSRLTDVIYYANDIIFPYQPKQIVIYCGENDFASSDTVTAAIVFARFKTLYNIIRAKMPAVPVAFISIKPSPSRRKYRSEMVQANNMIKEFITTQPHTSFINVFPLMLNAADEPMPQIFIADSLHMNAKGYAIWQKAIAPYLVK